MELNWPENGVVPKKKIRRRGGGHETRSTAKEDSKYREEVLKRERRER